MAAGIFPTTLVLIPITYVLVVAGAIAADRGLAGRLSLTGRAVVGPLPAIVVGGLAALVVAPATVLRFALGYATVSAAFFGGTAVRYRRWAATVPTGVLLLGTWLTSTNTATEVVVVVGVAALPVSLLGYRLGNNPENGTVPEQAVSGA